MNRKHFKGRLKVKNYAFKYMGDTYLFLKHAEMDEFRECVQNHAYQMSRSNKNTLGTFYTGKENSHWCPRCYPASPPIN